MIVFNTLHYFFYILTKFFILTLVVAYINKMKTTSNFNLYQFFKQHGYWIQINMETNRVAVNYKKASLVLLVNLQIGRKLVNNQNFDKKKSSAL